jgi:hypothetical protein
MRDDHFQTAPGHGMRIHIRLPLTRTLTDAEVTAGSGMTAGSALVMKRIRVMLADDHDIVRIGVRYCYRRIRNRVVGEARMVSSVEMAGVCGRTCCSGHRHAHLNGVQVTANVIKRSPK